MAVSALSFPGMCPSSERIPVDKVLMVGRCRDAAGNAASVDSRDWRTLVLLKSLRNREQIPVEELSCWISPLLGEQEIIGNSRPQVLTQQGQDPVEEYSCWTWPLLGEQETVDSRDLEQTSRGVSIRRRERIPSCSAGRDLLEVYYQWMKWLRDAPWGALCNQEQMISRIYDR